jgi:hypothetical protein
MSEFRKIKARVVLGNAPSDDECGIQFTLNISIGKDASDQVFAKVKNETGQEPNMKPVVWFNATDESAASTLEGGLKDVPGTLLEGTPMKDQVVETIEYMIMPIITAIGSKIVISKEEPLAPPEMILEMMGPAADLLNHSQSIKVDVRTKVQPSVFFLEDQGCSLETLFFGTELNFEFIFHKDLASQVIETINANLPGTIPEDALPFLNHFSGFLKDFSVNLEFDSAKELPAVIRDAYMKNKNMLKGEMKNGFGEMQVLDKLKQVEMLKSIQGPVNICFGCEGAAAAELKLYVKDPLNTLETFLSS